MKTADENDKAKAGTLPKHPEAGTVQIGKVIPMRRELRAVSIFDAFGRIIEEAKAGKPAMGLTTGHYKLDARLCGLRRKTITTLGARTSFGKTSKALQIANLNLKLGEVILFISTEDNEAMCLKRLLAARAGVNALRLRANTCTKDELRDMEIVQAKGERQPFFVEAIGANVEDICTFIRMFCRQQTEERGAGKDTALVVVDYLQKIRTQGLHQDRRLQVGYIADEIGNTIKEHNAAGLLLSQVKRPDKNRPAEPPTLYDLKEAGEIENASEAVLIGHVEYQDIPGARSKLRTRKIKVEKNKDGPTFDDEWIDQDFDEYTASFRETQGRIYDDPQEELDLEPPELDDPRFL